MAKSKPKNDKSKKLAVPVWAQGGNLENLSKAERNDLICYQWFVKGAKQVDLATHLGIKQGTVSDIIKRFKHNDIERLRAVSVWEKEVSTKIRRKVMQTVDSLDPDGIPEGSKAQTVGILIDKARLIDGESTENVAYADMTRTLSDLEKEEEELKRRLRIG